MLKIISLGLLTNFYFEITSNVFQKNCMLQNNMLEYLINFSNTISITNGQNVSHQIRNNEIDPKMTKSFDRQGYIKKNVGLCAHWFRLVLLELVILPSTLPLPFTLVSLSQIAST